METPENTQIIAPQKKGGRPRSNNARRIRRTIRLDASEAGLLALAAAIAGQTESAIIRDGALGLARKILDGQGG